MGSDTIDCAPRRLCPRKGFRIPRNSLVAVEDFLNGRAVPAFGGTGDDPPPGRDSKDCGVQGQRVRLTGHRCILDSHDELYAMAVGRTETPARRGEVVRQAFWAPLRRGLAASRSRPSRCRVVAEESRTGTSVLFLPSIFIHTLG
jgi:hypothetical protein